MATRSSYSTVALLLCSSSVYCQALLPPEVDHRLGSLLKDKISGAKQRLFKLGIFADASAAAEQLWPDIQSPAFGKDPVKNSSDKNSSDNNSSASGPGDPGGHTDGKTVGKTVSKTVGEPDGDGTVRMFHSDLLVVPQEWMELSLADRKLLAGLLSWDSLSSWDFNLFEFNEFLCKARGLDTLAPRPHFQYGFSSCSPLLFAGWAILASPYSQLAMKLSLEQSHQESQESHQDPELGQGHNFVDSIGVSPSKIIRSLRHIETLYDNFPYHNNIHVTDVTQALHVLLVHIHKKDLPHEITLLEKYGVLLSAMIHDVGHEGLNNDFYIHTADPKAIQANNVSVLEKFHYQLGISVLQRHGAYQGLSHDQIEQIQQFMYEELMTTDMALHFAKTKDLTNGIDSWKNSQPTLYNTTSFLSYLLHAADISGNARPYHIYHRWLYRIFEEFFYQGDLEAKLNLPITNLCNRNTTDVLQGGVKFIQFVVQPMFQTLSQIIPWISTDILPNIAINLKQVNELIQEEQR